MSILFIDKINFHYSNFPQLFECLQACKISHNFNNWGDRGLKKAFGDYSAYRKIIAPWIEHMMQIPRLYWLNYEYNGICVFDVARYETLSHLMKQPKWLQQQTDNTRDNIFHTILERDFNSLLDNMAAACFWINYWSTFFEQATSDYGFLCVFGNSLSYTRSAIDIADRIGITCYVFEHLFTGLHHYMEPRSSYLQGASALRLPIPKHISPDYVSVDNAIALMKNKNSKKCPIDKRPYFCIEDKTILLITQVCNDFSLIGDHNTNLWGVEFYVTLIRNILNHTTCNILVKTHPYEQHKVGNSPTYNYINCFIMSLDDDQRQRVQLFSEYSLEALIMASHLAVSLSSQAMLEVCRYSIPVALLSDAFFAGHGFTHDFSTINSFIEAINVGDIFVFTASSREQYYRFMTWTLQCCIGPLSQQQEILDYFAADNFFYKQKTRMTESNFLQNIFKHRPQGLIRSPRKFFKNTYKVLGKTR